MNRATYLKLGRHCRGSVVKGFGILVVHCKDLCRSSPTLCHLILLTNEVLNLHFECKKCKSQNVVDENIIIITHEVVV